MVLNRHFREFLELLRKHGVEYLIVGGYAVGFHGFPRYTGDLDVFIAISPSNAEKISIVFTEFGFPDLGLSPKDFLEEEMVVEIGREPMKIQVLTGIDGVTFDRCFANKAIAEVDGIEVPFISLQDLIVNKAAAPRAKDKIDLDELKRIQKEQKP